MGNVEDRKFIEEMWNKYKFFRWANNNDFDKFERKWKETLKLIRE